MSDDHGSDICACGDWRSSHHEGWRCEVCGTYRASEVCCNQFVFDHIANPVDRKTWEKYHAQKSRGKMELSRPDVDRVVEGGRMRP